MAETENETPVTTVDNTVTNVAAGKPKITGAIYVAPESAIANIPTDATTALNSAFKCLGYVSEDGVTNGLAKDTSVVKAWGGDTVLATDNGLTDTFKYKLIECLNLDVLKFVYGSANVTGALSTGVTVGVKSQATLEENIIVIETVLRNAVKRIVIPRGAITEVGEIKYADNEAIGYDLTVTAFPGSDGDNHKEYIKAST